MQQTEAAKILERDGEDVLYRIYRTRKRSIRRLIRRQRKICFIKQRIIGLACIALGIAIPYFLDGDATTSILIIPLGLYALFGKELIIYDGSVAKLEWLKEKERGIRTWK